MLLEVMPAPKMAQGGGMPSYRSRRYSFSSSKVMMSTPAYGKIPICTHEKVVWTKNSSSDSDEELPKLFRAPEEHAKFSHCRADNSRCDNTCMLACWRGN